MDITHYEPNQLTQKSFKYNPFTRSLQLPAAEPYATGARWGTSSWSARSERLLQSHVAIPQAEPGHRSQDAVIGEIIEQFIICLPALAVWGSSTTLKMMTDK